MVVSYLEKIREKFQVELVELDKSLNDALNDQRENIEIIKLLEINDDPTFESFTPRPVNSFNKKKILELKEEQSEINDKISLLKQKIESVKMDIKEVDDVIKAAKECIF